MSGEGSLHSVTRAHEHAENCEWHVDQYPWECTCDALTAEQKRVPLSLLPRRYQASRPGTVTAVQVDVDTFVFAPDAQQGTGEFSIGGQLWPGLSKLIEECGEVLQVGGKLIGSEGRTDHWSGDLRAMLHEEIGDLRAAIDFFVKLNGLDVDAIEDRRALKLLRFLTWQREGRAAQQVSA